MATTFGQNPCPKRSALLGSKVTQVSSGVYHRSISLGMIWLPNLIRRDWPQCRSLLGSKVTHRDQPGPLNFEKKKNKERKKKRILKVDMPILTCTFYIFNWLTLTSSMHFVKFHPEVASCLISRGKRKYAPLVMRLLWKYIRNYFLVYQLISHFLLYLQNYKEFEAEILDLQSEKYGLSFDVKKYTSSGWALGDENVIGIRAFKV